jgi:hypothetical protein
VIQQSGHSQDEAPDFYLNKRKSYSELVAFRAILYLYVRIWSACWRSTPYSRRSACVFGTGEPHFIYSPGLLQIFLDNLTDIGRSIDSPLSTDVSLESVLMLPMACFRCHTFSPRSRVVRRLNAI